MNTPVSGVDEIQLVVDLFHEITSKIALFSELKHEVSAVLVSSVKDDVESVGLQRMTEGEVNDIDVLDGDVRHLTKSIFELLLEPSSGGSSIVIIAAVLCVQFKDHAEVAVTTRRSVLSIVEDALVTSSDVLDRLSSHHKRIISEVGFLSLFNGAALFIMGLCLRNGHVKRKIRMGRNRVHKNTEVSAIVKSAVEGGRTGNSEVERSTLTSIILHRNNRSFRKFLLIHSTVHVGLRRIQTVEAKALVLSGHEHISFIVNGRLKIKLHNLAFRKIRILVLTLDRGSNLHEESGTIEIRSEVGVMEGPNVGIHKLIVKTIRSTIHRRDIVVGVVNGRIATNFDIGDVFARLVLIVVLASDLNVGSRSNSNSEKRILFITYVLTLDVKTGKGSFLSRFRKGRGGEGRKSENSEAHETRSMGSFKQGVALEREGDRGATLPSVALGVQILNSVGGFLFHTERIGIRLVQILSCARDGEEQRFIGSRTSVDVQGLFFGSKLVVSSKNNFSLGVFASSQT